MPFQPSASEPEPPTTSRSAATNVVALTLLAATLVTIATWPALPWAASHLADSPLNPDVQAGLWWPHAFAQAIVEGRNPLFQPALAWPDGQDIRLLVWNILPQAIFTPISLLFEPLTTLNLIALISPVLNGLAAAWAAHALTRSRTAAVGALIVASVHPYGYLEGATGRPEQALWFPLPVYLVALSRLIDAPTRRKWAAIGAASLAIAGAIYWFYAYFLVVLTIIFTAWRVSQRTLSRSQLLSLIGMGIGSGILASPFMWPVVDALLNTGSFYGEMRDRVGDPMSQQAQSSLHWPNGFAGVFGRINSRRTLTLTPLIPLTLAWGAWRGGPVCRRLAAWGIVGVVFAAGPILAWSETEFPSIGGRLIPLPGALLDLLPGFTRFWWPYRWQAIAVAAASLITGILISRRSRPGLWLAGLAVIWTADTAITLRGGLSRPVIHLARYTPPAGFKAIRQMGGDRPILVAPFASQSMVAWQAWSGQPIDSGLAWNLPMVRTEGWEKRRKTLPLLQAIDAANTSRGDGPAHGPWTSEDTGGFHYLALLNGDLPLKHNRLLQLLEPLVGEPFYCDTSVILWAIPGVGTVPQGYFAGGCTAPDPVPPH